MEPSWLAEKICADIFHGDLAFKLNTSLERAALDVDQRLGLDNSLGEAIITSISTKEVESKECVSSLEWVGKFSQGFVSQLDQENTGIFSTTIAELMLMAFMEYEFQLHNADKFIEGIAGVTSRSVEGVPKSFTEALRNVDVEVSSSEKGSRDNQWIRVYPRFNGATGIVSLALLWELVRLSSVQVCQPVQTVSLIFNE